MGLGGGNSSVKVRRWRFGVDSGGDSGGVWGWGFNVRSFAFCRSWIVRLFLTIRSRWFSFSNRIRWCFKIRVVWLWVGVVWVRGSRCFGFCRSLT